MWSPNRLAKKFGCNRSIIRYVLGRHKVETRSYLRHLPEDEVCDLYDSGLSGAEIARKFQCANKTVYLILEHNGRQRRPSSHYHTIEDLPIDEIGKAHESGETLHSLSKKYSCSHATLSKYLREAGYKIAPPVRKRIELPLEKVIDLYHRRGHSAEEIAICYDCGLPTIIRRLVDAEVPIRNRTSSRIVRRRRDGRVIMIDSRWEARAYSVVEQLFGNDNALFQGEFGDRHQFRAPTFQLRQPNGSSYVWHPDFVIPSKRIIIEVKGFGWGTWDDVIVPALKTTTEVTHGWKVYVWYDVLNTPKVNTFKELRKHLERTI